MASLQSLLTGLPAFGERAAVGLRGEFGARWWSYRRLHGEAIGVAALLRSRGIEPGDRIVLWGPNCPEWVAYFLGAVCCGVVVVPIDEQASPRYVQQIGEEVGAVLLVHGENQDVRAVDLTALLMEPIAESGPFPSGFALRLVKPDDPAVILYTSGTTVQPKGVVLTHGNLLAQMAHFRHWRLLLRAVPIRLLNLSPLSHSQGLLLGICIPLSIGLSVLYSHSVSPAHVIRTIRHNRITILVAVPRVQHVLIQALRQHPSGRRGLTLDRRLQGIQSHWLRCHLINRETHGVLGYQFWILFVGGAVLPRDDEEFWRDGRYRLVQGYGLTETAAIVSINARLLGGLGSIGKPLRGQEVAIADDGELLVRGPNVSGSYAGQEAGTTPDGFLHTGDLVRRDARQRLYFVGRKSEVIVNGEGFNIVPQDVEAVLNRVPGVVESVVVGASVGGYAEVHAVLLLEDGIEADRVVRQANACLQPHQAVRSWTVWPEADFPRTSLMKIKRADVAARIAAAGGRAELSAAEEVPSLDAIRREPDRGRRVHMLAHYIAGSAGAADLGTSRLEEFGLGSLDIVELLSVLERSVRLPLDSARVPPGATLGDVKGLTEGVPGGGSSLGLTAGGLTNPFSRVAHTLLTPVLVRAWFAMRAHLTVSGAQHLRGLRPPFIVAGIHHEHGIDVLAIYQALPRDMRRKLAFISGSWVFREYFAPPPGTPPWRRLVIGAAYHLGVPLLFPFAILPRRETTRQGLFEVCRLIDRGFSPIIFPEDLWVDTDGTRALQPGVGIIAAQTRVPILPLRLEGNEAVRFKLSGPRHRIGVRFGAPIMPPPHATPAEIIRLVRAGVPAAGGGVE